jgi:hypothetical protein
MTAGLRAPDFIKKVGVQFLTVFGAQLEHMADFNGPADFQRLAALHAGLTRRDGAQIEPRVTLMSRSMETCFK